MVAVVSQDNDDLDRELQALDYRGEINFDLPSAIDREAFASDVETLLSGRPIYRKKYTFNNPDATPSLNEILPAPVLMIEGLFVFYYSELQTRRDLQVIFDARDDV